jgi:hypothetical protein
MVFYTGLDRVARDAGLEVREVSGWESRTMGIAPNGMSEARGVLWHHTATSASAVKSRNNPTLNYMVNGLGYPLCNYALAWDGSIDVVAAGAAAHAGKGNYSGIPRDKGNYYLIGIEVEGTTGLTWSDAQLEAAARLGHALTEEWGDSFLQIGHMEYAPNRKVDPTGIPGGMSALRSAIKRGYWEDKNWKPGGKVSTGSASSGSSSSSSGSRSQLQRDVVTDNAEIKDGKGTSAKTVGTPSKGYTLNVVEGQGSWTKVRWNYGTRDNPDNRDAYIATRHLDKPAEWPHAEVPVTAKHTSASHNAYVKMLDGVGFEDDPNLTTAIQKWLQWNGYYKSSDGFIVDGKWGAYTTQELQKFLKAKDFYTGVIDGDRGPMTVGAEIKYINSQAKYYR